MNISRELAISILRYVNKHKNFFFPFLVLNREYSKNDDNFVEIEPREWMMVNKNKNLKTFQLSENLQYLDEQTLIMMSKGFIDWITANPVE